MTNAHVPFKTGRCAASRRLRRLVGRDRLHGIQFCCRGSVRPGTRHRCRGWRLAR